MASRRNSENFACFWCDWWWLILLILAFIIGGYFLYRELNPLPEIPEVEELPELDSDPDHYTLDPDEHEIAMCPGDSVSFTWSVEIPPAPTSTDVLFAFDQTASMAEVIEDVRDGAEQLMNSINDSFGDVNFGVIGFADYPTGISAGDIPYQLLQPISSEYSGTRSAIAGIELMDGADVAESYTRAIYESYADNQIAWRENSRHFLVIFGDSYPKEPDPGVDGIEGTTDDLSISSVLNTLKDHDIILIFIAAQTMSEDSDIFMDWKEYAEGTGGVAVSIEDQDEILSIIETAITDASKKIDNFSVTSSSPYDTWVESNEYNNVYLDDASDVSLDFDVEVTLPATWSGSVDNPMTLRAMGDGASYDEYDLTVTIPASCGD